MPTALSPRTNKNGSTIHHRLSGERAPLPGFERDRFVFTDSDWPTKAARELPSEARWEVSDGGHVLRSLVVCDEDAKDGTDGHHLWEAMLRFPNAPIYGTHHPREHLYDMPDQWPNYHTMRVLGVGDAPKKRIRHVYLLHNGLNETADLLFHYRLAAWILAGNKDAVCILRPLPGHLTRFPFDGPYAELPLDGYLRDPADLFRQFLRYMVETDWLLSVLVPRSFYGVAAGTKLVGTARPDGVHRVGRSSTKDLATRIGDDWRAAFRRSEERRREIRKITKTRRLSYSRIPIEDRELVLAIGELRRLLRWKPVLDTDPPRVPDELSDRGLESPSIHVVGYSMGGFMAQAVFFSWPYAISSCTNLFAGGALRDLAPTAFAHPEEWQAVLHGLRYELDRALEGDSLRPKRRRIAGIGEDDFGYLKRIFYEVFLQYYRGGYSSRVREFSRRLLFVVGGSDPIVRTKNVLDAGPPEGMTLLQLADLSHFQGPKAGQSTERATIEKEQRKLWLPEVGGVISRFSRRSARALQTTLAESWVGASGNETTPGRRADYTELESGTDGQPDALDSAGFEGELDRLVDLVDPPDEPDKAHEAPGVLLISRNELPPVFLGELGFLSHASALHHSEDLITRYVVALRQRADRLSRRIERISLLIPRQTGGWFVQPREQLALFSKSETPGAARTPTAPELREMWKHFEDEWVSPGAVGLVDAGEYKSGQLTDIGGPVAKRHGLDEVPLTILPDVWISLSAELCDDLLKYREDSLKSVQDQVVTWAAELAKRVRRDEKTNAQKELDRALRDDSIRVVKVSAAELNPRYRGQRLVGARQVRQALIHWALAYRASTPAQSS
jgi:hypothetical protein